MRTAYALKWDGDMVLTDAAVAALRDLAWQLEAAETVVRVPRLPLYVADDRTAFVDTALRNCEPWAWPNRPGYRFAKALEWELPMFPAGVATRDAARARSCVELKFLDADEFAPLVADRLRRLAAHARASGASRRSSARSPAGARAARAASWRVEAPAGRHVIDHVRHGLAAARRRWRQPAPAHSRSAREPAREPRLHAARPPGARARFSSSSGSRAEVVELAAPRTYSTYLYRARPHAR